MKNFKIKNYPVICAIGGFLLTASSCSQENAPQAEEYVKEMDYIPVAFGTRTDDDEDENINPFDDSILDYGFVKSDNFTSTLYISQLARGLTPFLDFESLSSDSGSGDSGGDSGNEGDPDDTEDTGSATRNLYIYKYDERDKYTDLLDWDNGFNFFPAVQEDMLDWDNIRQIGPYGNGFTLFGMYFPHSEDPLYTIEENSNNVKEVHFSVKTDQSNLLDLQLSNIMGAYHTTSSLYTRLRFRLFHLMVYLKVNVYVPVFRTEIDKDGNSTVSGYPADALRSVNLLGVYPEYTVNWSADRSSDWEGPLVQLVTEGKETTDIPMYRHDFTGENGLPQQMEIPTINFDPNVTDPDATDEVWVYTYSVLFPEQGSDFGNTDNLLRFVLRNNLGLEKNYVFNGGQSIGAGSIAFRQGNMQVLNLYLPRDGGEAVLVTADLDPWIETGSDMHVSMDPSYIDPAVNFYVSVSGDNGSVDIYTPEGYGMADNKRGTYTVSEGGTVFIKAANNYKIDSLKITDGTSETSPAPKENGIYEFIAGETLKNNCRIEIETSSIQD